MNKKQPKPSPEELERQTREFDAAFRQMMIRSDKKFEDLSPYEAFRGMYPDEVIDRVKAQNS